MTTCCVRYEIDPAEVEDFERYRARFGEDTEFVAADRIRDEIGCVRRYERTFMRPLLA